MTPENSIKKILNDYFINDLSNIIIDYINEYVLLDWVEKTKLNFPRLCSNPNAIDIIEKNLDKINWWWLSENPNAIHILEKNLDKIVWTKLSQNPNAIHILEKNIDKIDWYFLSKNLNIFT